KLVRRLRQHAALRESVPRPATAPGLAGPRRARSDRLDLRAEPARSEPGRLRIQAGHRPLDQSGEGEHREVARTTSANARTTRTAIGKRLARGPSPARRPRFDAP